MAKLKTKDYPNFQILSTEEDKIFWTITEVSNRLELEPYILRFWEKKFKKLQPTQKNSGTRYYKIGDIRLIEKIRDLLYKDGYTIEGAIKALNKRSTCKGITKSDYKNIINKDNKEKERKTNDIEHDFEENNIAKELLNEIKEKYSTVERLKKIIDELDEIEKILN